LLNVSFWGVRGSTPCPCDENRRYGGNTACVAIESPGMDPIVLDLGTGLRFWGGTLPMDGSFRGSALVTHLHWDHVQGLPFFAPINCPGARLDIYAPRPSDGESVEAAFEEFMRPPYFPVRATDLFGEIRFHDAPAGEITLGPATVKVGDVPHVGATNGYRVEVDGVSIAYISDHQQPLEGDDVAPSVIELCRDADLVIHDAQFLPDDFAVKSNWGHCTVEYAVHVAAVSGARRLALFHHDPARRDDAVDALLADARRLGAELGLAEVVAAYEGLTMHFQGAVEPAATNGSTNGKVSKARTSTHEAASTRA
jgi:phosphoribosyl 1,2-cyclic phosphodiesterase